MASEDAWDRVQELLSLTGADDASAAWLLCDRHDPHALAYRFVSDDLSARDMNYGELRISSERFAHGLWSIGIRPGDRVATLMGKSPEYLIALMGIWRLGAVYVPLFTAFAQPTVASRLKDCGAKLVICDAAQQSKLTHESQPRVSWRVVTTGPDSEGIFAFDDLMNCEGVFSAAAVGGNAPFIHIFTSGTTGKAKGVVVPLRALAAFWAYAEFGLNLRPDDLYWCAADPGWAYGLYFGVLGSLSTGTPSLLLSGGFSPATTFAVLGSEGVTAFAAAPTVFRSLRNSGLPAPPGLKLRCVSSAGEPLTPETNEWATGALGVPVHDHYGQTEAGMLINNHHHPLLRRHLKSGSMGRPMPGWTAVLLEISSDKLAAPGTVGRIVMDLEQSPLAFFESYEGDAEKSSEKFAGGGRWYVTGDIGSVDEDGDFHFASREDDVIIMAGYRIGPVELEAVILLHPAAAECAVIATPDQIRGEVIELFVVLTKDTTGSDELSQELKSWVRTRYALHAYPRVVHFIDALPKTPSGKIQRAELRARRLKEIAASLPGAAS